MRAPMMRRAGTPSSGLRRALAALVLGALAVALPRATLAAPFDLTGHDWEGASDFVALAKAELGASRVVPTKQLEMRELKREDSIILLHPERTLDAESFARFMRAGGRVLALDDYGTADGLLLLFQIERVPAPRRPAEALRNNPSFAIAEPASPHPVVADVAKVVTNHATGLRKADLSPVLKIRGADDQEPDVLVALAGQVGDGRLLAVGDPSIVMNAMLRYPGNRAFARGLVKYAADDDAWGKRGSGKIYIVSGAFEQKGAFGDEGLLGDDLRDRLRAIEDALASMRRDGMPPVLAYALAVAAGLAVIVWIASRAMRTHKPAQPRFTREIAVVAQGGVAGHAAVIGAPHTSRVLAMLELKAALEEDLCAVLGIDRMPGHEPLLVQLANRELLDTGELGALRRLFARLAAIETMVLAQRVGAAQPGALPGGHAGGAEARVKTPAIHPIKDREVLQTAKEIKKILQHVRARADHGGGVQKLATYHPNEGAAGEVGR